MKQSQSGDCLTVGADKRLPRNLVFHLCLKFPPESGQIALKIGKRTDGLCSMVSKLRFQVPCPGNNYNWSNLGDATAIRQHALLKGEGCWAGLSGAWVLVFSKFRLCHWLRYFFWLQLSHLWKWDNTYLICFSAMLCRIAWLVFLGFNW